MVEFGKYCFGNFNLAVGGGQEPLAELITKQQRAEDTLVTNTFEDWDKYI